MASRDQYILVCQLCAEKLVQSLSDDLFPDEETEKLFGIVMNDTSNNGLGDLIYRAWQEIFQRKQAYGQSKDEFKLQVSQALTDNQLAPVYRQWLQETASDEDYPRSRNCSELLSENLTMGSVIHPTDKKHGEWMERLSVELGSSHGAQTVQGAAAQPKSIQPLHFCQHCGSYKAKQRCSACKEAYYCDREHQKKNFKKHKTWCQEARADPVSVWIQVEEGEGSGLMNRTTDHIFANKVDGFNFACEQFGSSISAPLRSPFCELTGWNVEIYCRNDLNDIHVSALGQSRLFGKIQGRLNAAGAYLGCDINDGLTRYNNLMGPIFVTGRRQADGKPLNKDCLWGLSNFIWDAMDLYDGSVQSPVGQLRQWSTKYKNEAWVPAGGDGGVNVYSNNFEDGAVDHR